MAQQKRRHQSTSTPLETWNQFGEQRIVGQYKCLTIATLCILYWPSIRGGGLDENTDNDGLLTLIMGDKPRARQLQKRPATFAVSCLPPRTERIGIPGCEPTCAVFTQPPPATITCNGLPDMGCFCAAGLLIDVDGTCVALADCGCYLENGYHPTGEVWTSNDCTQMHTCLAGHNVQSDPLPGCDVTTEMCQMLNGSYTCVCRPGYLETPPDSGICEIDPSIECPVLASIPMGSVDTPDGRGFLDVGTYSCQSGYELRGDPTRQCQADSQWDSTEPQCWIIELIECGVSDNCDVNAACTDSLGTFFCTCRAGYTGTGETCEALFDCDHPGSLRCSIDAFCEEIESGIACACKPGYTGNGFICTDIEECGTSATCDENADCNDVMGTYECVCRRGFRGDGHTCDDVEECGFASYLCDRNAECVDCGGSYECRCKDGFYGNGYACSRHADYGQYGDPAIAHSHPRPEAQHGTRLVIKNNIHM